MELSLNGDGTFAKEKIWALGDGWAVAIVATGRFVVRGCDRPELDCDRDRRREKMLLGCGVVGAFVAAVVGFTMVVGVTSVPPTGADVGPNRSV